MIDTAEGFARRYGLGDRGFVLVRFDGYEARLSRDLDARPLVEYPSLDHLDVGHEPTS